MYIRAMEVKTNGRGIVMRISALPPADASQPQWFFCCRLRRLSFAHVPTLRSDARTSVTDHRPSAKFASLELNWKSISPLAAVSKRSPSPRCLLPGTPASIQAQNALPWCVFKKLLSFIRGSTGRVKTTPRYCRCPTETPLIPTSQLQDANEKIINLRSNPIQCVLRSAPH